MASVDILSPALSHPMPFTPSILSSSPLPPPSAIIGKKSPLLLTRGRVVPVPKKISSIFTCPASGIKISSNQNNFGCVLGTGVRSFNSVSNGDHALCQDGNLLPVRAKSGRKHASSDDSKPKDGKITSESRKAGGQKGAGKLDGRELKKPRKPRIKKGGQIPEGDDSIKGGRAKKLGDQSTENLTTNDKKVRKPRAKRAENSQQKLTKGRITKATSQSETVTIAAARKTKEIESGSTHIASAETVDPFADPLDHGLVEAVKRRTAWTPQKDTSKLSSQTTHLLSNSPQSGMFLGQSSTSEEGGTGFVDLWGSFGFNHIENSGPERIPSIGPGTRKRKLIELVSTGNQTSKTTSRQKVTTKKKATTITGLATSVYAVPEDSPGSPGPLLQYFCRNKAGSTRDGFQAPRKSRSKVQRKDSSKTSTAKKGTRKTPILLSPDSALKVVGHQNFVFGTSSQLAREESPTLLRDLHEAMRTSNEMDHDPFAESIHDSADPPIIPRHGTAGTLNKYSMWSAAARDMSGELFDIEMIDLADSPATTKRHKLQTPGETTLPLHIPEREGIWYDIEGLGTSLTQQQPTCSAKQSQAEAAEGAVDSSERTPNHLKNAKASEAKPKPNDVPDQIGNRLGNGSGLPTPDYTSYSTAQLAKEVASYRFKPVKSRDHMITLLEKCWEGKQNMAKGLQQANITAANPIKTSKRKVGAVLASSQANAKEAALPRSLTNDEERTEALLSKPKTTGACKYLDIDSDVPVTTLKAPKKLHRPLDPQNAVCRTIDDISDPPCTPSASGGPFQILTQSPQLEESNDIDASPELSPASSQARLFSHITRAITCTPPSKDPSNPSWHEKILLYDPIILEDLTVWLNTGALGKTGWDGEVWPTVVKLWCRSKSICCLWKANHPRWGKGCGPGT